ncbi:hypothetical protein [Ramlibacter pallidus]|uniref:ABM domain-containing protein n=1 Tax=Ramlibacter pallidus TaxID=2780087 RepID=A0ABR9S7N8_9BURK|nr:hypothetical protein [Ramlibacter pallidus]MBE7369549.1 hypothetical protein [Ramlibacter pallidus]
MKTSIVRYRTHPQHAEENAALVGEVFRALAQARPAGLHYEALRAPDGVSFIHVVSVDETLPVHPLTSLPAFQAFVAGIRTRCAEPPAPLESMLLGRYAG